MTRPHCGAVLRTVLTGRPRPRCTYLMALSPKRPLDAGYLATWPCGAPVGLIDRAGGADRCARPRTRRTVAPWPPGRTWRRRRSRSCGRRRLAPSAPLPSPRSSRRSPAAASSAPGPRRRGAAVPCRPSPSPSRRRRCLRRRRHSSAAQSEAVNLATWLYVEPPSLRAKAEPVFSALPAGGLLSS